MGYVTRDQLAGLGHEIQAINGTATDLVIEAASRLFDNLCEVSEGFFELVSDDFYVDRTFYGDDTAYLKLDPFTQLNDTDPVVIIDPDYAYDVPAYVVKDFTLVALDATKQKDTDYMSTHRFRGWNDAVPVIVSAKWGWAAIPADVTLATAHLFFHLWRTADPAFAQISNADNTLSVRTVPQIAQSVIDKYREKYSRRIVFA